MSPLADSIYAKRACEDCANSMTTTQTDQFVRDILCSAYILVSGHPRSLERLQAAYSEHNWSAVTNLLKGGSIWSNCSTLATILANEFLNVTQYIFVADRDVLECLLSTKPMISQDLTNEGKIMRSLLGKRFHLCATLRGM